LKWVEEQPQSVWNSLECLENVKENVKENLGVVEKCQVIEEGWRMSRNCRRISMSNLKESPSCFECLWVFLDVVECRWVI
jgi:hypothetical protein